MARLDENGLVYNVTHQAENCNYVFAGHVTKACKFAEHFKK
jgi:hypothetical protein